jgi:hypothetical protein
MQLISTTSYIAILALSIVHLISAQLVVPQVQDPYDLNEENLEQVPIELGFGWHDPHMSGPQSNGPPLLSDILGIDRSLSIFAGLGRSIESIVLPHLNRTTDFRQLV